MAGGGLIRVAITLVMPYETPMQTASKLNAAHANYGNPTKLTGFLSCICCQFSGITDIKMSSQMRNKRGRIQSPKRFIVHECHDLGKKVEIRERAR